MIELKVAKAKVTYRDGLSVLFIIPVDNYSEQEIKEFVLSLDKITFFDKDGNEFFPIRNESALCSKNPLYVTGGDCSHFLNIVTLAKINVEKLSLIRWEADFINQILKIQTKC